MNRTKHSIINSFWSIVSKIMAILLPFIARTVMLKVLGIKYLGLGSLFDSIISVLNLAELGVGSAIVYSMYKPIANNDKKTICALMNEYKKIYQIIGLIILIIGLLLIPFLPYLINGELPAGINLYFLYFVYLINTVFSYWFFAYKSSILNACQRNDIISKVAIFSNISMYTIQIVLLFITKNYYYYVFMLPVFSIIRNIITGICSKKVFPNFICYGKISLSLKNDIKKRVSGLMINKVAFASRNGFDSIIISSLLGLQTVAMYNNYYYIIGGISAILTSIISAILPSIGNSIAVESTTKNAKDMKIISFSYLIISGYCYSLLLTFYQPFMSLWVGEKYMFSNLIMISFSLYFLVEKTENIIGNYYDASGIWWDGKWKGIIEAITNLSLNLILCYFFGAIGVVIATIISMLFVGIPLTIHYLYKTYYRKNPKDYYLFHYVNLIKIIFIGLLVFYFTNKINPNNIIISFVLKMFLSTILYFILILVFYKNNNIFIETKNWIYVRFRIIKEKKH